MEIELAGVLYNTGKMDAKTQFHVMRRVAPLLARVASTVTAGASPNSDSFIASLATALAEMRDEDADFVMTKCLAVCKRQSAGSWAPVQASSGKLMFEDIQMPEMVQLVMTTVQENLGGFFSSLVPASPIAPGQE